MANDNTFNKTLKGCGLYLAGLLAAFLLFCLIAFLGMARGSSKARAFCDSIAIGEPVSAVVERARRDDKILILESESGGAFFVFPGFLFARASCSVEAVHGVVVSKSWHPARD
jgi:hypothetical protein